MGKEEEHPQDTTLVSITSEPSSGRNSRNNGERGVCWCCCCCGCGNKVYGHFGLKCVLVLLLSGALFLSAMFWLPPFFRSQDPEDLDLDSRFRGHAIVASFNVEKPNSVLQDNILQLEDDIFGEINVASIRVVVLYTDPAPGINITKVVFAVDPDGKNTKISSTALSLIHSSFEFLITRQTPFTLTASLFGEPFSFEVLKFQGGITIIPPQNAYLLQKVQIYFNFTLDFSIEQIQDNFDDLTSQLKSGLHLTSYENLYIELSNKRGSTVAPPTTVQSLVYLAVGITPSMPRFKQLAQTIKGSHSGNLGLNNTIFGKVKQVSLSSTSEHSSNSSGSSAPSASPSAAPQPHAYHPRHHHHHHSHHHHFHDEHMPPAIAPAPAPTYHRGHAPEAPSPAHHKSFHAPGKSYEAKPPSPGCHNGYQGRWGGYTRKQYHAPAIPPVLAPHHVAVPPSLHRRPPPSVQHSVPASSPLPYVVYTDAQPPTKSKAGGETPQSLPLISPSYSSSAGLFPSIEWVLALFLALVLHL